MGMCGYRSLQKIYTSQSNKNFPQEHPRHTKRNKSSQCKGGCSWGKFWESKGGLEGERTLSERGFSLPLRSFPYPPTASLISACVSGIEPEALTIAMRSRF